MLKREKCDKKIDWWGVGLLGYFMASKKHPFLENNRLTNEEETIERIKKYNPIYPNHFTQNFIRLLSHLLKKNPEQRLSLERNNIEEIANCFRFLKGVNWDELDK
ncbi:hypothetical protein MHBO_003864 [Bonamia ostreae]|uniref:Protein kinase domain-containing protein n=1 Tax=Bonamia ostreae TaxID=126728 RepID=A0ABV2ASH8_9EUKA